MFRVPSDGARPAGGRLVPVRQAHHQRHLRHGAQHRGDGPPARDRWSRSARMAAGLAHELNNPAAASLRAVESLRGDVRRRCSATLTSLAEQTITADAVHRARSAAPRAARPSRARRAVQWPMMDREDALGTWLERHDVDQPWQLAPALAAAGADDDVARARSKRAVGAENVSAGAALDRHHVHRRQSLLSELTDTTNRISNLVGAVKTLLADGPRRDGSASTCTRASRARW